MLLLTYVVEESTTTTAIALDSSSTSIKFLTMRCTVPITSLAPAARARPFAANNRQSRNTIRRFKLDLRNLRFASLSEDAAPPAYVAPAPRGENPLPLALRHDRPDPSDYSAPSPGAPPR